MVDENRRNILKFFIGSTVALSLGALTTPLVGSVINTKALALKGEYSPFQSSDRDPSSFS
jgi:ubiquinol-cytochrome c reductase iron-sulfur subunit/cytochrome b6-f complex iron-sulfur subunit